MSGVSLYQARVATLLVWSFSSWAMTVPSVSNSAVPRLTGGLLVVRVQGDGADVFCISAGGLAGVNGTRTLNAHGKAGSPLNAEGPSGGNACAKHEAVSRKLPRTRVNDSEADLRLSITRFYLTRCSEAKLRRERNRRSEGNRLGMPQVEIDPSSSRNAVCFFISRCATKMSAPCDRWLRRS